ncbi:MAG: response regulator, partial [Selenomonadaceae bacterium]|nr:response regulator [Selenomonadaceae bacterium]
SGYDTLKMVAAKHYDIIFLDHRMPGMDGIETLQQMKTLEGNKCADSPVISLTANAISGAREQYIAAGFKDYLTKPINSAALENLLIKYLPPELVKISAETADETVDESSNLPDWLKNLDGINSTAGVEHCGGVDSYVDALTVFANAVNSGADEIQNYFDSADWKNYTVKVHALKSSARVIGAMELSERAKRLEDAGNAGYVDEIKKDTPELLRLYRTYAEKLSPLIEVEVDDDSKPLIEPDALAEAYETLQEVAQTFDYDTLNFVIQSLDEYRLPDAEREKMKALKDAASKLDWEQIKKIVDSLTADN